jgi:hypothetical protein
VTIQLLAYHVGILNPPYESTTNLPPSSGTEIWLNGFMTSIAIVDSPLRRSSSIDFANTHYSVRGVDVLWLCTVGLGCVCGEDCQDED